ncbi:MAG: DNA polymerase II [Myxococcales bacterium]|nr:DNA polymerase II [Myxococcales bacterium]
MVLTSSRPWHTVDPVLEGFLLTRTWRDTPAGLELELWASTDEGPVRLRIDNQRAVFFLERQVQSQAGERQALELTSMLGRPVDALYFKSQRGLVRERERLLDAGQMPLEADLKPVERYLMERFITGSCSIAGELTRERGHLLAHNPSLSASDYRPELRVASFDIETDHHAGTLLSIGLCCGDHERVLMLGQGEPAPHTRLVPDERALLEHFVADIAALDPDVLIGWNVIEFDLRFLIERARALGLPLALGRGARRAEVLAPRSIAQPYVARVPGRVVLDGIAMLRSASFSFESFALENVAQALLGRGKRIDHAQDKIEEILRLYREDRAALAAYNLEDCRLVQEIFEKTDLIGFALERQRLTGLPMDRQGGAVAAFDHLYLPRLHRAGHVAASVGQSDFAVSSPGGYVMDSRPGLYRNVLVLDFKSLYPSIIRTFLVDPMGLAFPGDDGVEGFEGASFARERHILPELIEGLWSARDQAKARGDRARSQAIKILMNSFYGVLGTPGCRFFNPKLASSITRRGHRIIHESRARIEAAGHRVIYGDTDSLFVWLGDERDRAACARIGHELVDGLNQHFRASLREQQGLTSHLELEFETHYERFFMPTMRHSEKGSKKRYAGLVASDDGGRLVIKGLEAVRSDWTPLARDFQRQLLWRVFTDKPYQDLVADTTRRLLAGELDDRLIYRKRLRRAVSEYVKNVPPHVQAARKLPKVGRDVRYYMTLRGPEPVEARENAIDYDHYLQKQLAPAADGILHFCGTDFARLGGRQLALF